MSSRTSRSLTLLTLLELNLYTSRDRWKRRDAQSDVMRDGDAVVPPVAVARVLVSYGYRLLLTYRAQTPSPLLRLPCRNTSPRLAVVHI